MTTTRRLRRLRPTPLLAAGMLTLLAGGVVLATAAPANAAVVRGAITDVTVTPTNPAQGSQLTTDIEWCAPDGAQPGDTFTLTLDDHLRRLPTGFALVDPATEGRSTPPAVVANATITNDEPWVVTFTFTDYLATHHDVCGSAFVKSDFDGLTTPSGQPTPITSVSNDGQTFTTVITPTGVANGTPAQPSKYGTWTRADQGTTNGVGFLEWHVDTPNGPYDSAVTTDTLPANQAWDCDSVYLKNGYIAANGDYWAYPGEATGTVTCSTRTLSVTWPAEVTGERFRVEATVSAVDANGTVLTGGTGTTADPATFSNNAVVTTNTAGTTPLTQGAGSSLTQATAGGEGDGTPNATPTTPPAAPVPSPTPSPSASQVPSAGTGTPTPSAVPVAAGTGVGGTDALAFTGSEDTPALWAGGALVLLGGVVLGAARLRARNRTN